MIRRAVVKDANAVHAVLLTACDDIPLASNFADDAHKTWIFERDADVAGVMVMAVDEIFYLATAPAHRKEGVAEAFVKDAKARVWKKHREPARGRVRPENLPVVRLLEKLGFVADHDMLTQAAGLAIERSHHLTTPRVELSKAM